MKFEHINKLCSIKHAFSASDETHDIFIKAMVENYKFQLERQPYIRFLADKYGIEVDNIHTLEDVYKIPFLFVETMKYNSFCSVPKDEVHTVLTSSGTKGQKTQSFFDKGSMDRLQTLAFNTFDSIGYRSSVPVHYFIMSYDINTAKNIGTSWSDNQMMNLAPAKSKHWVIEWDEKSQKFHFDVNKWANKFIELSSDAPVRLLGFPAFMYQMVEEIKNINGKIKVREESFILAGGGWKNHLGKSMGINEFANYMEENIGLKKGNIGDTYGMAEHGVPYCSCEKGHYHIPVYGHLIVRDPLSMKIKDIGEEGLLQLVTPYNIAQSNLSVLSTDLVVIGENCSCGIKGKYIKSIRRGGNKKHKGCAIAAQEILKNS